MTITKKIGKIKAWKYELTTVRTPYGEVQTLVAVRERAVRPISAQTIIDGIEKDHKAYMEYLKEQAEVGML